MNNLHPVFRMPLAAMSGDAVRSARECRAKGNHLSAQNDEPEPKTFAAIEADATADARKAAEELEAAYLASDRARNEAKASAPQREADAAQRREIDRMPNGGYLND
jgi:hypothetical protein